MTITKVEDRKGRELMLKVSKGEQGGCCFTMDVLVILCVRRKGGGDLEGGMRRNGKDSAPSGARGIRNETSVNEGGFFSPELGELGR